MAQLIILPAAKADLIEIGDFIAQDNPARALSFVAEIEAKMLQAAERPESFPARDDVHTGLRSARHGRYPVRASVRGRGQSVPRPQAATPRPPAFPV